MDSRQARFAVWSVLACTGVFLPPSFLPCTPVTGFFKDFYGEDEMPLCALLGWQLMLFVGFMYTSHSTCERPNPFLDRRQSYSTIVKVQVVGLLLFWIGPAFTLAGRCGSTPEWYHAFAHNVYVGVAFVIGLQYTFLDTPALQGLVLSVAAAKSYTTCHWSALIGATLLVLGTLSYTCYVLATEDRLQWYAVGIVAVIVALVVTARLLRRTHYFHGHHYAIFMALIPLFPGQHIVSAISLGLVTGIFVEGSARWCMDPIFERKKRKDIIADDMAREGTPDADKELDRLSEPLDEHHHDHPASSSDVIDVVIE